ncbi:MAG: diguanylate cyclase domain-containing protein [Dehalococcoidia bacterium]
MASSNVSPSSGQTPSWRAWAQPVLVIGWVAVLAYLAYATVTSPGLLTIVAFAGSVVLFGLFWAQVWASRWVGRRQWRSLIAKAHGSAYISDIDGIPNRNYLLSELRREMPRARAADTPFVLVILSLEAYDEVVDRRGAEFGQRAIRGLGEVLRRFTRTSDFVAHLDGSRFCAMLNECTLEDSFIYLQRVPGTIAVSDGHRMLEVPVAARLFQYDLEGLYATDVLRDAEEAPALRRRVSKQFGTEAA